MDQLLVIGGHWLIHFQPSKRPEGSVRALMGKLLMWDDVRNSSLKPQIQSQNGSQCKNLNVARVRVPRPRA